MATQTVPTKKKSKGWPTLGSLRENDKGPYIKLADNVEVYVDGVKVDMNEKRVVRLEDPRKKIEELRDKGHIDEKTAGDRLEQLSEMTWLVFNLVLPPPMKG